MSYSTDKQMKRAERNLILSIIGFVITVFLLISAFDAPQSMEGAIGALIGIPFYALIAFLLFVSIMVNQSEVSRLKNLGKSSSSGYNTPRSYNWRSTYGENMGRDKK